MSVYSDSVKLKFYYIILVYYFFVTYRVLHLQPLSSILHADVLYNGFYCFEAISERNLDDAIGGICGVLGEVYLGDGNEKNCCSRKDKY